jgi:hypothetical protein
MRVILLSRRTSGFYPDAVVTKIRWEARNSASWRIVKPAFPSSQREPLSDWRVGVACLHAV